MKRSMQFSALTCFIIVVIMMSQKETDIERKEFLESTEDYLSEPGPTKNILWYTQYEKLARWHMTRQIPFKDCPITNCMVTHKKNISKHGVSYFDALMFNDANLCFSKMPDTLGRRPDQVYIYVLNAYPSMVRSNLSKYDNFFNWTMTYRKDSDVQIPQGYARVRGQSDDDDDDVTEQGLHVELQIRKKLLFWEGGQCTDTSSTQDTPVQFVQDLKLKVDISIFGGCSGTASNIERMREHKFGLALKVNLCNQFGSRKFWRYLESGIVPVVDDFDDEMRLAPPNSYISAKDFSSLEKLGKYLDLLDNDDEEYMKYHAWREEYLLADTVLEKALCDVCMKLHDPRIEPRVYADLNHWINDGECEQSDHSKSCPSRSIDLTENLPYSEF